LGPAIMCFLPCVGVRVLSREGAFRKGIRSCGYACSAWCCASMRHDRWVNVAEQRCRERVFGRKRRRPCSC
jgi:hypothetical protein